MAKLRKHFEFELPFIKLVENKHYKGCLRPKKQCTMTITGVAYYYPNKPEIDQIKFDIDHVIYEKHDIKEALEAVVGDLKSVDKIFHPCLNYARFLFESHLSSSIKFVS